MKKIIAALMIIGMLAGCASVKDFLCKPTQNEQSQAQVFLSRAIAISAVLQTLPQVPAVVAAETALALAISTFQSILSGICVNYDIVKTAQNVVSQQEQIAMKLYALNLSKKLEK